MTEHGLPEVARPRIVVVGTGYVGLPAALLLAHHGFETIGIDINENVVRAINDRTLLINEIELQQLLSDEAVQANLSAQTTMVEGDVFIVAVPTPVDPVRKIADLTYITTAVESVCDVLRPGNLVIIESTIPPLATRSIIGPLISERTGYSVPDEVMLAHCPERILPGDIFQEIVNNERLIGGIDHRSTAAAMQVYSAFVKGALHPTDDLTAELSKLMENTYRDVNIALANELAGICRTLGASPREVFRFANRHPRVSILEPGIGVGGHCIPVDPWFLKESAPYNSRLISTARLINDEMPDKTSASIRRAASGLSDPKIVCLGASYKRDSEDMRESPALVVVASLQDDGYRVTHFDPLIPGMAYSDLGDEVADADLLVILVAHTQILRDVAVLRSTRPELSGRLRVLSFDSTYTEETNNE